MKKLSIVIWFLALTVNVFASASTGVSKENKHWTVDPYLYADNMTMVGLVELNDVEIRNESYEIGAFCGDECRGSEILKYYQSVDRYLVFLTIYGETGDQITFKLYDHESGYEFIEATAVAQVFAVNAMYGMPSNPYVFDFSCPVYSVTCQPNAAVAGSVSGGGSFFYGKTCTVTATTNMGFVFRRWTENGSSVCSQPNYTFEVTSSRNMVAEFYYSVTDTVAEACEHFTWHGHTYQTSGVYHDTLTSSIGIDSIVALHLTLHQPYHIDLYESSCGVYYWDDEPFEESGDYVRTFESVHGCDSIETLHLTILPFRPVGNFGYMNPANNYVVRYTDLEFYWSAVSNANVYDFYLWQGDGERPDNPAIANTTSLTYHVYNLTHGGVYHWCVVAKNECDEVESAVRTFTCQLDPSMSVVPRGTIDFGEVELGHSSTKAISVSGIALTENISYAFLGNGWGQDAPFFQITPSNWEATGGGMLHVTFTPDPTQLYYNTAIRIASGTFTDTVYFVGSVANRYVFTTEVEGEVYSANDSIEIHGHVEDILGNVVPNLGVEVYMTVMGLRMTMPVMSDANGDYTVVYVPRYSESGYYQVGSCLYGDYTTAVHDAFDIPGIGRVGGDFIIWIPYQDETVTGEIEIRNRSRIPVSGIQVNTLSLPSGCTVELNGVAELGPLETGVLHYTVTGSEVSTGNSYEEALFEVTSAEGVSMNLTCYYYCRPRRGALEVYPPSVATTLQRGKQKAFSFQITNNGNGETGPITISVPGVNLMSVMGESTLPSLQVGDSCAFTILMTPGTDMDLSQYSGSFAVNCANGNGTSVPYQLLVTADTTTTVIVDVTDDYTYNTNNGNGPHLAGANVSLTGYYTLETVAEGMTDENGLFTVEDVPEGYYYLSIHAESHKSYDGIIYVDACQPTRESRQEVYLQFQAITYSWVVVPTEIQDEYTFELVADIKTNVPVPVVVIDAPSVMDTLAYGDSLHYSITVTNYGLIDALDVQLTMPVGIYEYDFYALFDHIDTLPAKTSVVVPCVLTRTRQERDLISRFCDAEYIDHYFWMCNAQRQWEEHVRKVRIVGTLDCGIFHFDDDEEDSNDGINAGINEYILSPSFLYWYQENFNAPNIPFPSWITEVHDAAVNFINTIHPPVIQPVEDCTPCWKALPSAFFHLGDITGLPIGTLGDDVLYAHENANTMYDFAETAVSDPGSLLDDNKNQLRDVIWWTTSHAISLVAGKSLVAAGLAVVSIAMGALDVIDHITACIRYDNPYRDIPSMNVAVDQLDLWTGYFKSLYAQTINLFPEEEWMSEPNIVEFLDNTINLLDPVNHTLPSQSAQQLAEASGLTVVNDSIVQRFVDRWNRSIQYWEAGIYTLADLPAGNNDDFIKLDDDIVRPMREAVEAAEVYGFDHVGQMFSASYGVFQDAMVEHSNDVCASISVSFKQKMTMTREAFEGTLKITNGHPIDPMQDIKVDIVIRDMQGVDRTGLFQVNEKSMSEITGIDGTGTLDAQTEGTVQFEIIPTNEAAPDTSVSYAFGGSFSFLDPFSGDVITYPLFPVKLQVNPSPDLHVDYFVSRHILSDDPLTADTIEAAEPAELAMMIRNVGAGDAKNVFLQSIQPQIVDNQNGLLIQFDMMGSAMNGEERPLGLTDIPFGTIASHTAGIAEWYFTSSLLARVIHTTPHVIHNNSYGNPKLSLVTELHSHELIKAITVYGDLDDGINDFMVNETSDFGHTPDMIYFSHGGTSVVKKALSAQSTGSFTLQNSTVTLNLTPRSAGWNYACTDDPGEGLYEIISCTRNDGQEIPLSNVWITRITMPDDGAPIHENKLHIVDTLATTQAVSYLLVYASDRFRKITVQVSPSNCGQVTGEGYYMPGDTVTLVAVPSFGCVFDNWSEGGNVIATDSVISFIASANRNLTANFHVSSHTVQLIHFSDGWNWFSSYITYEEDALTYMEEQIGYHATMALIKSHSAFTMLDENEWAGALNHLINSDMYMIRVDCDLDFTLTGTIVKPWDFPITLYPGWTWVCFISNKEMTLEQSLVSFSASEGDVIKSQRGFSAFESETGQWFGSLTTMIPGEGYAYLNNGTENQTLVYPNFGTKENPTVKAETHWNYDWHRFMGNMTMMISLDTTEFRMSEGSHEIAAFMGNDCRGSARLQEVNGHYIAFLTVGGIDGEEVRFRLFDVKRGEEDPSQAVEVVNYNSDAVFGSLRDPFLLHFRPNGMEEETNGVSLFPNPTNGKVTVIGSAIMEVKVYNVLGQLVLNKACGHDEQVELNLGELPAGFYTVSVQSDNGIVNKILVKE